MIKQTTLIINTQGRKADNITHKVNQLLSTGSTQTGLCHLFVVHTSSALMLAPNEDVKVLADIENYLQDIVPDDNHYQHHNYKADMAGHLRSLLLGCQTTIPINDGQLVLGKLQGLYLYEFNLNPNNRKIIVSVYE